MAERVQAVPHSPRFNFLWDGSDPPLTSSAPTASTTSTLADIGRLSLNRAAITTITGVLVCVTLLYFKPAFVMKKEGYKHTVSCTKLVAWVTLSIVIVGFREKLVYLYRTLLSPIQANICQFVASMH